MTRHLVITCCLSLAIANRAHAVDPHPDRTSAPFWGAVSDPERQRADALVQQAQQELTAAMAAFPVGWEAACKKLTSLAAPLDLPGFSHKRMRVMASVLTESMQRLTHIENAIARLREAQQHAPDNADVLHALGLALREWERPGPLSSCRAQRRDAEAIATLEELRLKHPNHRPASVAFDLAIVYTRALQFDRAAQCYADGAPLEINTDQLGVLFSNWAEVTMLAGDLIGAVRLYQRALDASTDRRSYLLPLWGMAVALDRLGERDSALEHIARALHAEGGSMAVLHSDGVFFEPESEIHYYEGLGHEAAARLPTATGAETDAALEHAVVSWRAFFSAGGDQTPWATSARDNLTRIEAELARRKTSEAAAAPATRKPQRETQRRPPRITP